MVITKNNIQMNHNEERYPGNEIHLTAVIADGVKIGTGNKIGAFTVIGAPAEWKGKEKEGWVVIGDNNVITSHVSIDSGSESPTVICDNCYIMAGSHISHDCGLGNSVIVSAGACIGGHCCIGDMANIGMRAVIHQRQVIAQGSFIGMGSIVSRKMKTKPFKKYSNAAARLIGDNTNSPHYEEYTINLRDSL